VVCTPSISKHHQYSYKHTTLVWSIMDLVVSTPEIRAALRFSLTATWQSPPASSEALSISNGEGGPPQGNSPMLRKLVEGILFSRRFVLSYHAIIVGLLVVCAIAHWGDQLRRWRKRGNSTTLSNRHDLEPQPKRSPSPNKDDHKPPGENGTTSSSSSSTLHGNGSPPHPNKVDEDTTEGTALLSKHSVGESKPRDGLIKHVRAWLNYQPRPIPIINRTLPSNGTTLAILGFVSLNLFYMFYRVPFSIPMVFIFADRTSIMFVANLPLLYLFAAKNQPIKLLTGYSYESLNIIHRRLGELMCFLALIHSAGMVVVWYTLLRPTGFTFARFIFSKVILLGIGAFVAYELLYFTSLGSFRQRWYELFLGLHIFLQVVALILVWFHHSNSRVYVGIALGIFVVDRLAYRMALKVKTLQAGVKILEDEDTVALSMVVPLSGRRGLWTVFASNITDGWKPTEHIFITVPSLARKHILQAHPFTIASPAPTSSDSEAFLDLVVRAQDGFSADLMNYAKSHKSVTVRLDGPYGSQCAIGLLRESDLVVVVAGGSGIAVAWPMVWSLSESLRVHDLECQPPGSSQKVVLIWVVHKRSHISWIGEDALAQLQARGVEVILPEPTEERGRPDIASLIEDRVESRHDMESGRKEKIGVVCSGPDGMNRVVRNTCSSLMARGQDVSVAIEKFGW